MDIEYYHFDEIPSTNSFAKENLALFSLGSLSVVTAVRQSAGRGRRERSWVSLEGNLFLSFVFSVGKRGSVSYGLLLALTACRLLREYGVEAFIKWPNDLLIQGKKVGGVLGEAIGHLNGTSMVLGIGLNLNTPLASSSFQEVHTLNAITLFEAVGQKIDLEFFHKALSENFKKDLVLFEADGFSPFQKTLEIYSFHPLHSRMSMKSGQGEVEGEFLGFGPNGEIHLRVLGREQHFFSGDIV